MSSLTVEQIDTADPSALAEALRRVCEVWTNPRLDVIGELKAFAKVVLAMLDDAVKWYNSAMTCESILQAEDGIRAAATAWVAAGGELEVADE